MMKDRGGLARSYRSKKAGGRGGDENKPGTPSPSSCQAPLREDGELLQLPLHVQVPDGPTSQGSKVALHPLSLSTQGPGTCGQPWLGGSRRRGRVLESSQVVGSHWAMFEVWGIT